MANEHSSLPGQTAAMVTSVIAGTTIRVAKQWRKIVMKRWLCPNIILCAKQQELKNGKTNKPTRISMYKYPLQSSWALTFCVMFYSSIYSNILFILIKILLYTTVRKALEYKRVHGCVTCVPFKWPTRGVIYFEDECLDFKLIMPNFTSVVYIFSVL